MVSKVSRQVEIYALSLATLKPDENDEIPILILTYDPKSTYKTFPNSNF